MSRQVTRAQVEHAAEECGAVVSRAYLDAILRPLAAELAARQDAGARLIGISGAQASGKTTLSRLLAASLSEAGVPTFALSIDDLYLTRAERKALAASVHPLCATRGVPGTHDVALGIETIDRLLGAAAGEEVLIPIFDKLADDRLPRGRWRRCAGPVALVLLEGWCVGAPPIPSAALAEPFNALEREEDAEGRWRRWSNDRLKRDYLALWRMLDAMILLRAPNMKAVIDARLGQERELAANRPSEQGRAMDREAVARFVAHYERWTHHIRNRLSETADIVIDRDADFNFRIARL
ncbi:MAG: kinase [Parvularculaceae bacterium]